MKNRKSKLGRKLLRIMNISMFLMVVLVLIGSGYVYSNDTDTIYKNKVSQIANTIAQRVDGDFVRRLSDIITTDEYKELYSKATFEDQTAIEQYMKDNDIYDRYMELNKLLDDVRINMDISYLYIQVIRDGKSYYIAEPTAGCYALGHEEDIPEEYGALNSNDHIDAKVSLTEEGWFSSGGEPLLDSNGDKVAVVCVDLDMNDIMGKRLRFIVALFLELLLIIVVTITTYSKLVFKSVVEPVKMLTDAATHFGTKEEGFKKENVVNLDLNSGDEIEDMYHEFRYMQESIIDYMDNLETVTADRERVGAEIKIATAIQQGILEKLEPNFVNKKEYDMYAAMRPAREVGGDFYDFFMIDDNKMAFLIADVSDKGVGAAFFMAIAKTIIKTYAQMGGSPSEIMTNVDKRISEKNDAGMFVTVWLAMIDLTTGHVVSCNAGHDYPAISKNGEEFVIEKTPHGPPVAFIPGMQFVENEFDLKKGDRLFLYTDGLNEAKREDGERFGTERMLEVLNGNIDADNKTLIEAMTSAVDEFAGGEPQFDDMTMLGFTYFGKD